MHGQTIGEVHKNTVINSDLENVESGTGTQYVQIQEICDSSTPPTTTTVISAILVNNSQNQ